MKGTFMKSRLIAGAAVFAMVSLFSVGAHAQGPSQEAIEAMHKACGGDVQRLCAGVQPGGGRIGKCLQANWANVSAGCKQVAADIAKGKYPASASAGAAGANEGSPVTAAPALPLKDPGQ